MDDNKVELGGVGIMDKPDAPQTQTSPGGNMQPPQVPTAVGSETPQDHVNESPVSAVDLANTSPWEKVKHFFKR